MSEYAFTSQAIPMGRRGGKTYYIASVSGLSFNQIIIYFEDIVNAWFCKSYPDEEIEISTLFTSADEPLNSQIIRWETSENSNIRINLSQLTCAESFCMMFVDKDYAINIGAPNFET